MERDDGPWRGEVWTHIRTLGRYAVVGRATNRDPDGPPDGLVVYRRLHQGAYYVRTLANFRQWFVYLYGPPAAVAGWVVARVRCRHCCHEFVSVYEVGTPERRLECPRCGAQDSLTRRIRHDDPADTRRV